ncbi:MAG: SCP2 sterol-binding domain-containing protein [Acidimicrobiales bacterium]
MTGFASPEWIAAFDRAVRDDPNVRAAASGLGRVVVEQQLTDSGERWHVVVDHGVVRVCAGPADSADVTLAADRADAAAIHAGTLAAQAAFMDGRLRISGNVAALSRVAPVFAAFDAPRRRIDA